MLAVSILITLCLEPRQAATLSFGMAREPHHTDVPQGSLIPGHGCMAATPCRTNWCWQRKLRSYEKNCSIFLPLADHRLGGNVSFRSLPRRLASPWVTIKRLDTMTAGERIEYPRTANGRFCRGFAGSNRPLWPLWILGLDPPLMTVVLWETRRCKRLLGQSSFTGEQRVVL